jgi:hypothetical protein
LNPPDWLYAGIIVRYSGDVCVGPIWTKGLEIDFSA